MRACCIGLEKEICNLYSKMGKSIRYLCKLYNSDHYTVRKILTDNNLEIRNRNTYNRLSKSSKEICSLYESGFTIRFLMNKFHARHSVIKKILNENDIKITKSKYIINEKFFKTIDKSEKAYLCGLLAADGSINRNNNGVGISLQSRDRFILYKIKKILQTEKDIDYETNGRYARFRIHNKQIKQDLIRHGLIPNKTFSYKFPKFITKDLIYHYIRGHFDGDGYIYINKRKRRKPRATWSIVGNNIFCDGLRKFLEVEGFHPKIYKNKTHNEKIVELRLMKALEVSRIYKLMYDGSGLYLSRKYLKMKEFVENANLI